MLNKINLQGRLTRDVEVRNTPNQTAVSQFTLAVDRNIKNKEGKYESDFINCLAWDKQATFIAQHFHKGDQMIVSGRLQTRSYEKDGSKVYVTEVVTEDVYFCGSPRKQEQEKKEEITPSQLFEDTDDDSLPFDV